MDINELLKLEVSERLYILSEEKPHKKSFLFDSFQIGFSSLDYHTMWQDTLGKILFNMIQSPGIYSRAEDDIWFGLFFSKLETKLDIKLEAPAAITFYNGEYLVIINPYLFLTYLTLPEQIAIIKHEISHMINNHFERFKINLEFEITNVALDIAINPFIDNMPKKYIFNGKTYTHLMRGLFPSDYNLPVNKSAEYYFNILLKSPYKEALLIPTPKSGENSLKEQCKNSKEAPGRVFSKHGEDHVPSSNEISDSDFNESKAKVKEKILKEINLEFPENNKVLERTFKPASISKFLDIIATESELNWVSILKKYIGRKISKRRRDTFSKRHLLFPDEPYIPGRITMQSKPLLHVILDTSGSMEDFDIELGLNALKDLKKQYKLNIKLIQSDAEIQSVKDLDNDFSKFERVGYGGTEMFPAVNTILGRSSEAKSLRKKFKLSKPDLIIIITDGGVENDWEIKYNFPILWLVTSRVLNFNIKKYSKHNAIFMNRTNETKNLRRI